MDNSLGTGLGTGSTAGALFFIPDQLITTRPAGYSQPLLRVLCRNTTPHQVLKGDRHTLGYTVSVSLKLQLYPILL